MTRSGCLRRQKPLFFLFGMLITAGLCAGAAETIADMEKSLPGTSGAARIDLLNRLSFSYWSKDPQKGVAYGLESLKLESEVNYPRGRARALNCIGLNYYVQGDYANALGYYQRSLEVSRAIGDLASQANTQNNIGKLYNDMGSNDLALENYFQTLKIKEDQKDDFGVARVLNNIGEIYLELKRYDEALDFFVRSLELKKGKIDDREGQATTYQNIGEVYRARGNLAAAREQYRQSLIISQATEKKRGVADAQFSIAEVLAAESRWRDALGPFSQALKIREEMGDKRGIASCLNRIGAMQIQLGNYGQAGEVLTRALRIAESIGVKQEMQASYENFASLNAARKEYAAAYQSLKQFIRIKDEIYNKESNQKIANLGILYKHRQEIELQQLKLAKQKQLGYLFIVIIGLAFLSLLIGYNRYRMKVRVNRKLNEMNSRLDQLTRIDPLTQLANRRDFVEKIGYEITRYLRSRKVFSVVLGDIDDFKAINDRFGHECGDHVLVTVGRLIKETVREQDVVARWGGEEFILLLPETDPEGGRALSERIRGRIAGYAIEYAGQPLKVTMTLGVAAYIEGLRLDDCIAHADQAMYAGKEQGKNRVVLESS